ncbi:MAG: DUF1365 domain-containing protein [Cyclobacteriaceae bacterium]
MNSCLYRCRVDHHRFIPKRHKFNYGVYMFYLDLDELDLIAKQIKLISRNRFNVFGFYDRDHVKNKGKTGDDTKTKVLSYLKEQHIDLTDGKIFLLTYLRTLGYVFNPVSFYFCYDNQGRHQCVVAEVGNTFGEMKLFLIPAADGGQAAKDETKYFYVSPFVDLDATFNFKLNFPDDRLRLFIDDYKDDSRIITTSLIGDKQPLTDGRLLVNFLRFPLITLKVISMIHWQAFVLWCKGLNYHPKQRNMHLQKGVRNQRTPKVEI